MNLKQAYDILEIPSTATPEEAKRRFRELVKKYHPDINKDVEADDKIKKINEAYQVISTGKSTDREDVARSRTKNPFNPFGGQVMRMATHINLHATILFYESVLGCKKDLKFNRSIKCSDCSGSGEITLNNGCDKCNGRGQVTEAHGTMVFVQTCPKCRGQVQAESCKTCNESGVLDSETSINVTIPGGVITGNTLRLSNMGNYLGSIGPIDQYTDAHLHIMVVPQPGLTLDGKDVVSTLHISLLDALKGSTKKVQTISGIQEIEIKSKSRHKDEVIIPHLGVAGKGNQRVILEVAYPENVDRVISLLASN